MNHFQPNSARTSATLQQASRYLDANNPLAAEALLSPVLKWNPGHADALLLMGAARQKRGLLGEAEEYFRLSLKTNPEQAHVRTNLALVLQSQGRFEDALIAFRQAIRTRKGYVPAHFGMAGLLYDLGRFAEAEQSYRNVQRHQPDFVEARHKLGVTLNDLDRSEEAERELRRAAVESRDAKLSVLIEHALGVAATRLGRHEEALRRFDAVKARAPNLIATDHNRAMVLQHLGRDGEAVDVLKSILVRDPLNLDAHHYLNHVLYRLGRDDEFLRSYAKAINSAPDPARYRSARAAFLLAAEKPAEALEDYEQVLARASSDLVAMGGRILALGQMGRLQEAVAVCEAAICAFPSEVNFHSSLAALWLRLDELSRAETVLDRIMEIDPYNQTALAIRETARHLSGKTENYEDIVRAFDLDPPEGYASMEDFNLELDGHLNTLHPRAREYVDQSLRGGTQTVGRLFGKGHELIERLRVRIDEAISRYIAQMPDDTVHSFYGRRARSFRYDGSWSSRLRDHGFHTNHIHPAGWISSCYYVALPEVVRQGADGQGWIKFGEPPYKVNLAQPVCHAIQPKPGRLVLFPSYFWHGTVPFHAPASRTTIAFDVLPSV
jgi:tetratricopeptide (TPR) repeat protein